jgi:hypothetical protein
VDRDRDHSCPLINAIERLALTLLHDLRGLNRARSRHPMRAATRDTPPSSVTPPTEG